MNDPGIVSEKCLLITVSAVRRSWLPSRSILQAMEYLSGGLGHPDLGHPDLDGISKALVTTILATTTDDVFFIIL